MCCLSSYQAAVVVLEWPNLVVLMINPKQRCPVCGVDTDVGKKKMLVSVQQFCFGLCLPGTLHQKRSRLSCFRCSSYLPTCHFSVTSTCVCYPGCGLFWIATVQLVSLISLLLGWRKWSREVNAAEFINVFFIKEFIIFYLFSVDCFHSPVYLCYGCLNGISCRIMFLPMKTKMFSTRCDE